MPRPGSRLTNPRMVTSLGVFPKRCTIQQQGTAKNGFGEVIGAWADVAGHVDIPARVAQSKAAMGERGRDVKYNSLSYDIALNGYYSGIKVSHRAKVDDVAYDIDNVESDSEARMTVLRVKLVQDAG